MKNIILDTDFILSSIKCKIDINGQLKELLDSNFKISYLDKTLDELKNKKQEKLAKELIEKFNKIKTTKNTNVDNLILNIVKKDKSLVVATQDKELKEKLKKGKIAVITIRQQKYLILK
ncbi:MAG: hypothetical protein AABW46_02865 [Nanoarchaeota archaeon]